MKVLLINVDNIIISSSSLFEIIAVKRFMSTKFKLKDLGTFKYFQGLDIACIALRIILMKLGPSTA